MPNGDSRDKDALLTLRECALALRVSTRTVRRMVDRGDLMATRVGPQIRVSNNSLQNYVRLNRI